MEKKSLLSRKRDSKDERIVKILITEEGENLRQKALSVPEKIGRCLNISPDESKTLYEILYKILTKA